MAHDRTLLVLLAYFLWWSLRNLVSGVGHTVLILLKCTTDVSTEDKDRVTVPVMCDVRRSTSPRFISNVFQVESEVL